MAFLYGRARCLTSKNGVFRPGQEFEKDHDPNGHVDFLHAMANLRARCYGLPPMAWIDVRLKAGRIIPALVTTTAAVAGREQQIGGSGGSLEPPGPLS